MRLSVAVLAFLVCGASQAMAQDVSFSPEVTLGCLDRSVANNQRLTCIGASAQACMAETTGGTSTVGMLRCLDAEHRWWDIRLNDMFQQLVDQYREYDAELDALDSAAPRTEEVLRQMQRSWIAYRDARCDHERVQWGGGTGAGPATVQCLMQETAEQTLLLERYVR